MVQTGYFSSVKLPCDHRNYFLEYLGGLQFSINCELLCDFRSFAELKGEKEGMVLLIKSASS